MNDTTRRILVTVAMAVCLVGTAFGTGLIGTRVEESSGGSLAADATLLAPAGPAFTIWSVIYLGLLAHVVWQWLPAQRTSDRARATGPLIAVSMVLNAAWLGVTQVGWIWVSVLVIIALLAVLSIIGRRLARTRPTGPVETVVVDGTMGLYLGWVTIATVANIAAALASSGVDFGGANPIVAVVVLAVAGLIGLAQARSLGGKWGVGLALGWGLAWIAIGRLTDAPQSALVGVVAALVALLVLAATALFSRRTPAVASA
ncbi:hypothetical protein CGZ94_08705 [Enemella evansiae]|uniref:Tryptophan-rich sensory protein n=1 Tax=Enemella evansiae TaxID=2016499 RepID=A0A255GGU2_9ACTN|nr:TspO/MBR family protein [Enemella evansiae]OYO14642.1 hypothetical protein CGZ94_08705 [Enemella evansiae]